MIPPPRRRGAAGWTVVLAASGGLLLWLAASGCATPPPPTEFSELHLGTPEEPVGMPVGTNAPTDKSPGPPAAGVVAKASAPAQPAPPEPLLLREGDAVKVSFPGAPNLNTVATIRRDGKVSLPLVGEFQAAGLAPVEMEKELLKLYGPQLQVKEISVALESSAFTVYLSGSVLRPGKVISDRPISALEAIMEAGGFDLNKANLKRVTVMRRGDRGQVQYFKLNFKHVLDGKSGETLMLKPFDIVHVPERFSWF